MKNPFKTMSGVLALTFMLLFGAVAFAHTSTGGADPSMSPAGTPAAARNDNPKHRRHHRHHHRRHMRRTAKR